MAVNDLAFLVRTSDMMVLDRRRNSTAQPAFPTGYVVPSGQQIVFGNSDTDLVVTPNGWLWNGDTPATFTEAPDTPIPTGDVAGAIDALETDFATRIAELKAQIGL